jgi:multiple sugar transport system permease protein
MKQSRRQLRAGLGFTALWVVGLGVFTAYPVLASVYYSFCDYSVLTSPVWIGTENYQRLWQDDLFWRALRNTLYFAVFSVPLGAIASLSLALLLNQDVRGRPFFRALFYLPSIVPAVASSMLWLWIFNGQYGLLNYVLTPILGIIGLQPPIWLADPNWAKPALVMMSLWGVGNSMIIYLAGLQDVPKELFEAAEIDGAGTWRKFWHITLPCISPVIYFNVLMGTIGALQVFTQAFIMSGGTDDGSPARSTLFYALYLFGQAFYQLRMGYASAMAWILFVMIVTLTWLATKLSAKHVHYNR